MPTPRRLLTAPALLQRHLDYWVLCLQGHYVPAFAAHIYHTNKFKDPSKVVNLKGIAIGNGLTDPGAFVVGGDVLLVL